MVVQDLPQAEDVLVQVPIRAFGWLRTPELVGQPVDAHGLVRMQEQTRDEGALLRGTERQHLAVPDHLERTQDLEGQHGTPPPADLER